MSDVSGSLITRVYGGFRGVDFRGEEIDLARSPDSLNMYKDYKETDSIRTRPAMELIKKFSGKINGIFFYANNGVDMTVVHCGNKLYKVISNEATEIQGSLENKRSSAFISDGILYILDGSNYCSFDGSTLTDLKKSGYVPTTSIGRKPSGGGTIYEDVNLLSDRRINTFLADGESVNFYLDTLNVNTDTQKFPPKVYVNGALKKLGIHYTFHKDSTGAYVKFKQSSIPPAPLTDGQDNVTVEFYVNAQDYEKITKCTKAETFDNRVFVGGNPDYPNTIWHSSLNNPVYFSDLDYYTEGDTSNIRGIVAGNNALWVFKEPSPENTTVYYHVPTIDSDYGKIYPSVHSNISTGCLGSAINFNDDIVFFSDRGMEGISGDITSEQVISHRSSLVDRKLITEEEYKDMILVEWQGYLLTVIGKKIYLADSRAMLTKDDHNEYEWFYWEMAKTVTSANVNKGVLYLGTDDGGVYTLTDDESNVESYWVTPKDKFRYPHYLKTTNKRGCVVEALGCITVLVKTEKTDFQPIGTYRNITDYFVSRIKRKKFKDIQIKFYSDKRFSLETATLECYIGGYIKR